MAPFLKSHQLARHTPAPLRCQPPWEACATSVGARLTPCTLLSSKHASLRQAPHRPGSSAAGLSQPQKPALILFQP